jgi:hypothetical protein
MSWLTFIPQPALDPSGSFKPSGMNPTGCKRTYSFPIAACNESPQTLWLKPTQIYYLMILLMVLV